VKNVSLTCENRLLAEMRGENRLRGNEQKEIKHPDKAISIANLISSREDFFPPFSADGDFFLHPLRTLRKARKRDEDSSSKHGDFYCETMLLR
jgi:hypothetical protein